MLFKKYQMIQVENQTKIWVDKGSEFYNNSFKKWLKNNDRDVFDT